MREAPLLVAGCLVTLASLVLATARPSSADEVIDELSRAASLEQTGKLEEAARVLESLLPSYAQDYALPLQVGWLHERAGNLSMAEASYRLAEARSPGGMDARVGIARVLELEGRPAEAEPIWRRLVSELPDLTIAQQGLARCAPFRVTARLSATGTLFQDHPSKALAGGGSVGLGLGHRSGFFLDGLYRYAHFVAPSGAPSSPWDQHEGHFAAGWTSPSGAFGVHYSVIADGSGVLGTSHHAGFTARWSPSLRIGDFGLEGSASFYDDIKALRLEPSWRIPIVGGFTVRPAAGIADADGEARATAMLTLGLDRKAFALWAGGKYGDEARPVYLSVPLVYDIPERIPYGAWVGGSVNVSDCVRIYLTYSMDRLKAPADGTESTAHALDLGFAAAL